MTTSLISGNAILAQSGGPTAVINQSLVGVVEGLRGVEAIGKVLGARHGVRGMIEEQIVELHDLPQDRLDRVAATPSAALGSTRDKPDAAYCEKIFAVLQKLDVRYFFYVGGNDSSDTCRIVNELSNDSGYELRCFHVPKTVDNDLMENDHTPGYPSAARYVAKAFMGDNLDNAAIPGIKINVIMGRHAGFLTAASALGRTDLGDGPHLICIPERAFSLDTFTQEVARCVDEHGRCQIAVSEGIHDEDGEALGAKLIKGEADAHGNVQLSGSGALGDMLADYLKKHLTPAGGTPLRVRADTLGYPQRCFPDASFIDQREARAAGRFAAEKATQGDLDGSIAIKRDSTAPYESHMERVELTDIAAKTRVMPDEFIDGTFGVTPAFTDWLRPIVGELPVVDRLPQPVAAG
ncbi:MAG: 6-phosphofructokinase [Planctomycetota bacterium]